MSVRLHDVRQLSAGFLADAALSVETRPRAFVEITREVERFIREIAAGDGILFAYLRHTSASLVIQENADPDVRSDLARALDRLAPEDAGWIHDSEGPDDMPSHVKTMLTGVSLHVPVFAGSLALGTWQGIFLAEHRSRSHAREVLLQFVGTQKASARSAAP
jgi:secondary thiamine-phosphate synthase enzyme